MTRSRLGTAIALGVSVASGCAHKSATSLVEIYGDALDESGHPIATALVRLDGWETLTDKEGKYRLRVIENCLGSLVGDGGHERRELEGFAEGFAQLRLGVELKNDALFSSTSCEGSARKFVRLTFVRKAN